MLCLVQEQKEPLCFKLQPQKTDVTKLSVMLYMDCSQCPHHAFSENYFTNMGNMTYKNSCINNSWKKIGMVF